MNLEKKRKYNKEYMRKYRKTAKYKNYIRKYQKDWVKNNPDKHKAYCKKWRTENREYYFKVSRKWRDEDPDRYNRYKCNWQKKKRAESPKYKIDMNMGNSIRNAIGKRKAGRRWEKVVGYTLSELVDHLENQFDENMDWSNYGSYWEIDHIKPKSLFVYDSDNDEEFNKCWSLANLQPLEVSANRRKSNVYQYE